MKAKYLLSHTHLLCDTSVVTGADIFQYCVKSLEEYAKHYAIPLS